MIPREKRQCNHSREICFTPKKNERIIMPLRQNVDFISFLHLALSVNRESATCTDAQASETISIDIECACMYSFRGF